MIIMITLTSSIKELPRVGPAVAGALNRLGVATVRDLLFYFPYRYLDFSKFSAIKDIKAGEIVTLRGTIKTIRARPSFRGRVSLCEAVVSDETGSIKIVWFNQPYLAKQLKSGDEIVLSGKADVYKTLQLQNPIYEKMSGETIHTGRIVPVYRLAEGLYHRSIRNLVNGSLVAAGQLEEILPRDILKRYGLPALPEAVREIHFPKSEQSLESARARIIFEEVLVQQLAVQQHKLLLAQLPAPKIPRNVELVKNFLKTLPFTLTDGQKQALWQIMKNLDTGRPMNRLLEGDVGSGKTLVALIAALETAAAGFQTLILAPTEILANQHYGTFCKMLLGNPVAGALTIGLLTSQFHSINEAKADRKKIIAEAKAGQIDILIGTHALLGGDLTFSNLGLVVIDEQHRFGVEQRALLLRKHNTPHLLSMSATPIPRTLALAFYGDLDISALRELPAGRQPVATKLVAETERTATYKFMQQELAAGRQAFVITPRGEDS